MTHTFSSYRIQHSHMYYLSLPICVIHNGLVSDFATLCTDPLKSTTPMLLINFNHTFFFVSDHFPCVVNRETRCLLGIRVVKMFGVL